MQHRFHTLYRRWHARRQVVAPRRRPLRRYVREAAVLRQELACLHQRQATMEVVAELQQTLLQQHNLPEAVNMLLAKMLSIFAAAAASLYFFIPQQSCLYLYQRGRYDALAQKITRSVSVMPTRHDIVTSPQDVSITLAASDNVQGYFCLHGLPHPARMAEYQTLLEACSPSISATLGHFYLLWEQEQARQTAYNRDKFFATTKLAAGLAHEIKNPLTVLQGYTQIIAQRYAPLKETAALMLAEIDTIHALVNKMQLLALPEAPRREDINVNSLIQTAISGYDQSAIRWQPETNLPAISGDRAQLIQVLRHIVQNAAESAPQVDIFITARYHQTLDAVVLTIANTGPGMSPVVLAQADMPFFSTKVGTKGLGLTIARAVVENHGGTFTIDSPIYTDGSGARVCITLPCHQPAGETNYGNKKKRGQRPAAPLITHPPLHNHSGDNDHPGDIRRRSGGTPP